MLEVRGQARDGQAPAARLRAMEHPQTEAARGLHDMLEGMAAKGA
ncbi:hypothetical protein AIOL_004176 [Candidatus Rhodobacter oscarellae]|uniref:Uncharacterized protein n=1 Tax=Candidatus Rhodobacter oscarellae TaxID=1675527 RepID=A0A0J9E8U1_9RHOB|nr:hypothetical protein AIOL_004176 [Candidatus Rhodobacter lobularis]